MIILLPLIGLSVCSTLELDMSYVAQHYFQIKSHKTLLRWNATQNKLLMYTQCLSNRPHKHTAKASKSPSMVEINA